MVYKKELALQSGIMHRGGVPSLGGELTFISDPLDVTGILPYVATIAVSNLRGSAGMRHLNMYSCHGSKNLRYLIYWQSLCLRGSYQTSMLYIWAVQAGRIIGN